MVGKAFSWNWSASLVPSGTGVPSRFWTRAEKGITLARAAWPSALGNTFFWRYWQGPHHSVQRSMKMTLCSALARRSADW